MSVCTTETCERVLGIYKDIVLGNTETLDTLAVEDATSTGLLPQGVRDGDPISVDGNYSYNQDGLTIVVYVDNDILKLN